MKKNLIINIYLPYFRRITISFLSYLGILFIINIDGKFKNYIGSHVFFISFEILKNTKKMTGNF